MASFNGRPASTSDFAISSLENLNDQISTFVFSRKRLNRLASIHLTDEDQQTLRESFFQMRSLLDDAQTQFSKMAEDNRHLAEKIDGSLHETNEEMLTMKRELQRLVQMTNSRAANQAESSGLMEELVQLKQENQRLVEELEKARLELRRLEEVNQKLTNNNDTTAEQNQSKQELMQLKRELNRSQEQIHSMKLDQKKLKAEKLDLLGQMRQLYGTLEDKEAELKDFIGNYEQRITASEKIIKQMASERTDYQRLKWDLVQRAEALNDRSLALTLELDIKDQVIVQLEQELTRLRAAGPLDQSASSSVKDSLSEESLRSKALTFEPISSNSTVQLSPLLDDSYCQTFPRFHGSDHPKMSRKVSWSIHKENEGRGGDVNNKRASDTACQPNSRGSELDHEVPVAKAPTSNSITSSNSQATPERTRNFSSSYLSDEEKIQMLTEARKIVPVCWKASHVRAWLELDVQMPCYGPACADNIKSGRVLLGMTNTELDSVLGLQSPLHRRKLRLAIDELRHPDTKSPYPLVSTLTYKWVSSDWLPGLGLPQFSSTFEAHFIDGRLLNILTKKDLEKHLSVLEKLHQTSIICGIELLRRLEFDKRVLTERRNRSKETNTDLVVWTNEQVINWVKSIDLEEYAGNLKNSGIHGAVLVLDHNFTAELLAEKLSIPSSRSLVVRHLASELKLLITNATVSQSTLHSSKKSTLGRSPFVRSFRVGKGVADEPSRQSRGSEKVFNWRGSIGRAFGRKLTKDQIRIVHPELNTAKSLSNIDDSARRKNPTADDQADRLI